MVEDTRSYYTEQLLLSLVSVEEYVVVGEFWTIDDRINLWDTKS